MPVREVELPGVGKKYTVETRAAGQVVVVLHQTGRREIYYFAEGQSTPANVIELTSEEANQIGGILSQTYYEPKADPSRELVMKELSIDWLTLPDAHQLTERSIRDLGIREQSGASIVAILREGSSIINPDPDEVMQAADTLMVIGNNEQVRRFKEIFLLPPPDAE